MVLQQPHLGPLALPEDPARPVKGTRALPRAPPRAALFPAFVLMASTDASSMTLQATDEEWPAVGQEFAAAGRETVQQSISAAAPPSLEQGWPMATDCTRGQGSELPEATIQLSHSLVFA